MENMVFLIDLPRIEVSGAIKPGGLTAFGTELCHFLKSQGLEENLITSLGHYDFSETNKLRFIHSMYERSAISASLAGGILSG
jgi:hypothetical protein